MDTKICKVCGKELPYENFHFTFRSPDQRAHTCKACRAKHNQEVNKSKGGGGNSKLAAITPREMIEELRFRGYTGTLEYTKIIRL
jgi:hypothetical protein